MQAARTAAGGGTSGQRVEGDQGQRGQRGGTTEQRVEGARDQPREDRHLEAAEDQEVHQAGRGQVPLQARGDAGADPQHHGHQELGVRGRHQTRDGLLVAVAKPARKATNAALPASHPERRRPHLQVRTTLREVGSPVERGLVARKVEAAAGLDLVADRGLAGRTTHPDQHVARRGPRTAGGGDGVGRDQNLEAVSRGPWVVGSFPVDDRAQAGEGRRPGGGRGIAGGQLGAGDAEEGGYHRQPDRRRPQDERGTPSGGGAEESGHARDRMLRQHDHAGGDPRGPSRQDDQGGGHGWR